VHARLQQAVQRTRLLFIHEDGIVPLDVGFGPRLR
jgi:hypothetical protein